MFSKGQLSLKSTQIFLFHPYAGARDKNALFFHFTKEEYTQMMPWGSTKLLCIIKYLPTLYRVTSKVLTTQDSEAQSLLCSVEGRLLNTGPATSTLPGNCSRVLWPTGLLSYVCLVGCPMFPDQFARIQLLSLDLLLQIIISGQSDFQSGWNSLSKLGEINSR